MQTGTRGKTPVSPRNITGHMYAANLRRAEAEKRAKETPVDPEAIRAAAWREGYEAGHAAAYEAAFNAGWNALAAHLVAEGILDADEDQGDEASHEADEN